MSKVHFKDHDFHKILNYKIVVGLILVGAGTYFEDLMRDPYHLFGVGSFLYCIIQLLKKTVVGKVHFLHIGFEIVAITLMMLHSKFVTNYAVLMLFLLVMMEIGLSFKNWSGRVMAGLNMGAAVFGLGYQYWYSKNAVMLPYDVLFVLALIVVYFLGQILRRYQLEKHSKDVLYNELLEVHRQLKSSSNQLEELTRAKEYERVFMKFHQKMIEDLTQSIKCMDLIEAHLENNPLRTKQLLTEMKKNLAATFEMAKKSEESIKKERLDYQSMVDTFSEKTGIITYFHAELNCAHLENQLCKVVYKTLEEGLSNAARHSHTKHIWINLIREGDLRIRLSIRDDGSVSEAVLPIVESVGMKTMRERIESVGGHLFYAFHADEGEGFEIVAEFPLVNFAESIELE